MLTTASGHFVLECRSASRAAIASAVSSGVARFSKSSSITYSAPKFGALASEQNRLPGDADRVLDALASARAISSIRFTTASVRCDEAASGKLHVDEQIALVLRRNETGRRARETRSRSGTSRPP